MLKHLQRHDKTCSNNYIIVSFLTKKRAMDVILIIDKISTVSVLMNFLSVTENISKNIVKFTKGSIGKLNSIF